jgi:hypothetical protein
MKAIIRTAPVLLALAFLFPVSAIAMGPVDGEFGAVWWANDYDSQYGEEVYSSDAGAPGYRAEIWFLKKYGLRAERYSSDNGDIGGGSSDFTSLDFMWRAFSPTENNYIALGAGWQQIDLDTVGLVGDTSGVRVALEGRVALGGLFYIYGQGYYLPSLDDAEVADPAFGPLRDMDGHMLEAGVSWKMAPFVSMRGGYRVHNINFSTTVLDVDIDGEAESSGFLLGLSFRF